jgi:hypothetical protein
MSLSPGEIPNIQSLQVLQQSMYTGKFTQAQLGSMSRDPNVRLLLPAIGKCAQYYQKKDTNQNKLCLAMLLCHTVTQKWADCIKESDKEDGSRCIWEKKQVWGWMGGMWAKKLQPGADHAAPRTQFDLSRRVVFVSSLRRWKEKRARSRSR